MYPNQLPANVKSGAEKLLYGQLKSQLSDEFVVLFHVPLLERNTKKFDRDQEIDFLIVHPHLGLLVLEVKGGGIRVDGSRGTWYSRDRNGVEHAIPDPFEQARENLYELKRTLEDAPSTRKFRYRFQRGVAFPDIPVGPTGLGPDANREIIIDSSDLHFLEQSVRRVSGVLPERERLSREAVTALIDLLKPSREIVRLGLGRQVIEAEEQIRVLTERQYEVLNYLQLRRQIAIPGCAGSGKTMLAIEKARRLIEQGQRVLVTCYNVGLAGWISNALRATVPNAGDRLYVSHYHGLVSDLLNEAGIPVPPRPRAQAAVNRYYNEELPEILFNSLDQISRRFDAVIVDEGQDFEETWWLTLEGLLDDPLQGTFYIFFDSNQRIYSRPLKLPVEIASIALDVNCRSTDQIHEHVVRYHKGDSKPWAQGLDGPAPEFIPVGPAGLKDELRKLFARLFNQEGLPPDKVVILTPFGKSRSALADGTEIGNFRLTWDNRPRANHVRVSTIHSFKGLESPVVILAELDLYGPSGRDELLYVGLSRAMTQLFVLGDLPEPQSDTAFLAVEVTPQRREADPVPIEAETVSIESAQAATPATVATNSRRSPETVHVIAPAGELVSMLSELDAEQQLVLEQLDYGGGPIFLTGGPGTGKSVVALHALKSVTDALEYDGVARPALLFATYTNALVKSSEQQLREILGRRSRFVRVTTVDRLAKEIVESVDGQALIDGNDGIYIRRIRTARVHAFANTAKDTRSWALTRSIGFLSDEFILNEIGSVIEARGIKSLEAYLEARPRHQLTRLSKWQRRAIWSVYAVFRDQLALDATSTWSQLRRRAQSIVESGQWSQRFDGVVIDEAQDLEFSSLRMLVALCARPERLFVTADSNQSIYNTLVDVDNVLDSTILVHELRTSHRTTQQIMTAANDFLEHGGTRRPIAPAQFTRLGHLPFLRIVGDVDAEADTVAGFLRWASHKAMVGFDTCAVLVPTQAAGKLMEQRLRQREVEASFTTENVLDLNARSVKVLTLHSSKGLEFSAVAIAGFFDGDVTRERRRKKPEDDVDALANRRRVLYVGMTRARNSVLVVCPALKQRAILGELDGSYWSMK